MTKKDLQQMEIDNIVRAGLMEGKEVSFICNGVCRCGQFWVNPSHDRVEFDYCCDQYGRAIHYEANLYAGFIPEFIDALYNAILRVTGRNRDSNLF